MPPKKKVADYIRLRIRAGAVMLAPPVGPALGQHDVNIMKLCKAYNAAAEPQRGDTIPAEITVYRGRSFISVTKMPPVAELTEKAAGVAKGSSTPHNNKAGHLAAEQFRKIAKTKESNLNANDLDNAARIIAGTVHSMGVASDEI